MIDLEILDSCPQCGTDDFRDRWEAFDRFSQANEQRFRYACCNRCGLHFLRLRPTAATVSELYSDAYSPYLCEDGPSLAAPPAGRLDRLLGRGPASWRALVRDTYALPPGGGRLLDFGCGSARFLRIAADNGWDVTGADFSSGVVERIRAEGLRCVLIEDLWAAPSSDRFDVVRMNHVLEHLYDPVETLRRLMPRITEQGRLHAAVPNPAGLSARVFGTYWRGLEPRHILLYSPSYLRRMLVQVGFREVVVRHEPALRDWLGSLGFALDGKPAVVRKAASHAIVRRLASVTASGAALARAGDRLHAVAMR